MSLQRNPISLGEDTALSPWERPHMRPVDAGATAAADDPLLGLLLARAAARSRPRRRTDPHVIALVVEGGGMRGAVSAGMCLVLEAAGLMSSVDRVYGCSSGALSGCFAAAGQASLWANGVEDSACRAFIDPARALLGRPVLDLDFLFGEVIARRRPLSESGLKLGPEFRAVAVSASRAELRVLRDFESAADVLAAARASCSIPVLAGAPLTYRGEPMVDGGLLEPIPYRSALREGATHVLVLRSRDASYRAPDPGRLAERGLARAHPELVPLLHSCSERYNRDAAELERRLPRALGLPLVQQIAVPPGSRLVGRLSIDRDRIVESVRLGASTMASALHGGRVPDLPGEAAVTPRLAA
jgi:predicted patatin/cPLA2 family phospholipase